MPPTASLLQKLKLMFNLEIIAIQRNVALSAAAVEAAAAAALNPGGTPTAAAMLVSGPSGRTRSKPGLEAATVALAAASPSVVAAAGRLWAKRLEDVQVLLSTVTVLSDGLALVAHPPASTEVCTQESGQGWFLKWCRQTRYSCFANQVVCVSQES